MKRSFKAGAFTLLAVTSVARAQSSDSATTMTVVAPAATASVSAPEAAPAPQAAIAPPEGEVKAKIFSNPKFEDTSGITDLRLKAERGSLSRYSAKLSFGYNGPVIDDLSNPYQPDLDGSITHNPTSLRGSVSARYRWSAESALGFGTGVSRVTPFTDEARTDISTPFVSFDHSDRVRAYQLRESIEASMTTNPEMKNAGSVGSVSMGFGVMRNIHYSRLEVGFDTNLQYGIYSRPYDPGVPGQVRQSGRRGGSRAGITSVGNDNSGDGNSSAFSFGFAPSVRYRLSDTIGSSLSVHFSYYEPRSSGGALVIWNRAMSGRTGLDFAINKSIFFSPYVGFYPQQMSLSTTTLNFSTIISML